MKLSETRRDTEVLKYAAQAYAISGGAPAELLKEAAEWLLDCFKKTGDTICLKAAGEITKAYMEMGILDDKEDVFDEIMECLGTTRQEQFPKALYHQNLLQVKASQIRDVLGYWPKGGSEEESAGWAVKDIIHRVKNGKTGCRYYKRRDEGAAFELLVLEKGSYLLDLEKKKVYLFDIRKGVEE